MISFLVESWTWYAIAVVIIILRYISRWIQLAGFRRYQAEDYIMLFVFVCYTTLIVSLNILLHYNTNQFNPADIPVLTPASIKSRIFGSKLNLVVKQSMIFTIWGCKACLLCLYLQLTKNLRPYHLITKILSVYVGVSLIIMEILYFAVWCRPFSNYWAVPTPNAQCSTTIHHFIVNATFNISSDVLMLFIPMPLVIKALLPTVRKLLLVALFSLGIFVIACAVVNKCESFVHPFSAEWTYWYVREASTAIYVANIPNIWPLARKIFGFRPWNNINSISLTLAPPPPACVSLSLSLSRTGNHKRSMGGISKSTFSRGTNGTVMNGTSEDENGSVGNGTKSIFSGSSLVSGLRRKLTFLSGNEGEGGGEKEEGKGSVSESGCESVMVSTVSEARGVDSEEKWGVVGKRREEVGLEIWESRSISITAGNRSSQPLEPIHSNNYTSRTVVTSSSNGGGNESRGVNGGTNGNLTGDGGVNGSTNGSGSGSMNGSAMGYGYGNERRRGRERDDFWYDYADGRAV